MSAPYRGQCLCGAIRFQVSAEPLTVYACHCTDCQRRTGSVLAMSMFVKRAAIALQQGDPARYAAILPDGRTKHGRICAACGTRLWGEPQRTPDIAVVQTGVLDQPCGLTPVAHVWARSAQPWFRFPSETAVFATWPTDPRELVALWRRANPPPDSAT